MDCLVLIFRGEGGGEVTRHYKITWANRTKRDDFKEQHNTVKVVSISGPG